MSKSKYAYEDLLVEHSLAATDLTPEAQLGIQQIKEIEKAIVLQEKKAVKNGKKYTPSASTENKIKAFDRWIVREILDYMEDKNSNASAPPAAAATIIADIKKDEPAAPSKTVEPASPPVKVEPPAKVDEPAKTDDPKGVEIDKELLSMFRAGKIEVDLAELKTLAPVAYSVIFETYEKDGDNGIATTHFLLKETNQKFILTKK